MPVAIGCHSEKVIARVLTVFRGIGTGAHYPLADNPDRVQMGRAGLDLPMAPNVSLDELAIELDFDSPLGTEAIRLQALVEGVYPFDDAMLDKFGPHGARMMAGIRGMSDLHGVLADDRMLGGLVYFATLTPASAVAGQDVASDFGRGTAVLTAWWETERGF